MKDEGLLDHSGFLWPVRRHPTGMTEQLAMFSSVDAASLVTHNLVFAFLLLCLTSLSPLFLCPRIVSFKKVPVSKHCFMLCL